MKKIIFSALAALSLAACVQEQVVDIPSGGAIAFDGAFVDNATRAAQTVTTGNLEEFQVWGFVKAPSGVVFNKTLVYKTGGVWSYDGTQYWAPDNDYYFAAVAPVSELWSLDTAGADVTGPGVLSFTNNAATDLVYAEKKVHSADAGQANAAVALQFQHLLSKVKLTFTNSFGIDNYMVALNGIKMTTPESAAIDLRDEHTWKEFGENMTLAFTSKELANNMTEATVEEYFILPTACGIQFDLQIYVGTEKVYEGTKTATLPADAFEMGHAYNLSAEINADVLNFDEIVFTVDKVEEWVEADDVPTYAGKTVYVKDATEFATAVLDPEVGAVVLNEDIDLGNTVLTRAADEEIVISKSFVLDGNGKTLTYNGTDRAIDIKSDVENETFKNVTIKNLTINCTASYLERGINYNANGRLVLDGVKFTGTAPTYAVNFPGKADNANVTINNCELTGNIALNVWGENMLINVENSVLTSVDKTEAENYAAVKLNNDGTTVAEGTVINIKNSKVVALDQKGEPSYAFMNATETGVITADEATEIIGVDDKVQVAIVYYESNPNQFYGCTTLADAIAKYIETKATGVRLTKDIVLEEPLTIAKGQTVVIDLNGKTLSSVDNTTKNYELIKNAGTLTIFGGGKMTVEATVNSGWNRYSAVIANTVGGNLTVMDVTIEHLGGTDMAYGIDNLTNSKGTYAVTTIEGATVKSPYRAVRQFLNGIEASNELYVKSGSVLEGANKSIFFHDPSTKANTGKLVVEEGAELKGDVYLFVTAGSTEWPVEVSIAESSLVNSTVISANVPTGYMVVNKDGNWVVAGDKAVSVADAETFAAAMKSDAKNIAIVLTSDIDCPISSLGQQTGGSGEYKLAGESTETIIIDLNGHKLNITTSYWSVLGAKNDNAIFTIKNGTMTSSQASGTWNSYDLCFANCNYNFENVVFEKAIALEAGNKSYNLKNVSITETHDYYAIWVSAKGQNITIDGLNIESAGRAVKIDEQYVSDASKAQVTMSVSNATFKSEKKAAIVVKSTEGAVINWGAGNDITNVGADSTNAVWVDSGAAAYADKVIVNGASCIVEA